MKFLESVDDASLRDAVFTSYRLSVMTEFLLMMTNNIEESAPVFELIKKITQRYFQANFSCLNDKGRDIFHDSIVRSTMQSVGSE